jgi:acetyltransferase-like isoleucine patch superfamily enzyme
MAASRSGVAAWRAALRQAADDWLAAGWERVMQRGTIGPRHARARRFRRFGDGAAICSPIATLYGEEHIEIGAGTIIGPFVTLSAGIVPGQVLDHSPVVTIGERCLVGRGSGIVGHDRVEIGDDVFTGHLVYVTDANHGYEDPDVPIGRQFAEPRPVRVGDGSWLGHGSVLLPGACVGRHVVVGAGAVVTGSLPDYAVAVGSPARVVRRRVDGDWVTVDEPAGPGLRLGGP